MYIIIKYHNRGLCIEYIVDSRVLLFLLIFQLSEEGFGCSAKLRHVPKNVASGSSSTLHYFLKFAIIGEDEVIRKSKFNLTSISHTLLLHREHFKKQHPNRLGSSTDSDVIHQVCMYSQSAVDYRSQVGRAV